MNKTAKQLSPPPPRRSGTRMPNALRAFRHRNFRLYWIGQLVSLIGTFLQMVGQSWLVYQLSGSTLALGVVGFAQFSPMLVLAPFGGVVADRVSKRTLLILTQIGMSILALILGTLTWLGVVQVWHVIVLAVLFGTLNAFEAPARQSFVVEMVGKEDLMNAIALNSSVFTGARLVGPALGGLLIAPLGIASLFFINAVAFLAIILNLVRMRLPPFEPPKRAHGWDSFKEGIVYLRGHQTIRLLLGRMAVFSVFGISYTTLLPAYADKVVGSGVTGYGFLMSAASLGGLLAAIGLARIQADRSKGMRLMLGNLIFAVLLLVVAFSDQFWLSLLCLVGVGWGGLTQNALTNTLIQNLAPDALRGRVMSAFTWVLGGLFPIGSLMMGLLATWWGPAPTIAMGAGVILILGVWTQLRHPEIHQLK